MLKSLLPKLTSWFSPRESSGANRRDKKALGSEGTLVELQSVSEVSSLVPFDEHLLERSRTQWQFGDWASLARLDRDTIQHHPDRAKLALLAAAGRLQTGKDAEARQFARLAKDWGVGKRLISQILIAGVHNSIGRANAIGNQPHRALHHFESAINTGTPGGDAELITRARAGEQLHQLGLPTPREIFDAGVSATGISTLRLQPRSKGLEDISEALQNQKAELDAQLKKQADELIRLRKFLDGSLKKEVANAAKQIQAAMGLQNYFVTGDLPNLNPESHSWPVSPDFALYLVNLLELNNYDVIIEFGSGISTAIVAKTIAKMERQREGKPPVDFVSFDHLDQYYEQTRAQLEHAGLADFVSLIFAPLQDWRSPNGINQPYYACQPTLEALASKNPSAGRRLLVLVDGPPGNTCKHARYPALPLVLQHFGDTQIDLLMDDYIRDEEKEIVKYWKSNIEAISKQYTLIELNLEKGACLLEISRANNKTRSRLEELYR